MNRNNAQRTYWLTPKQTLFSLSIVHLSRLPSLGSSAGLPSLHRTARDQRSGVAGMEGWGSQGRGRGSGLVSRSANPAQQLCIGFGVSEGGNAASELEFDTGPLGLE